MKLSPNEAEFKLKKDVEVIRTYVEKKRTPRKISQKKSHDKRPFVEKSKIELGDLVMINQHKKNQSFRRVILVLFK